MQIKDIFKVPTDKTYYAIQIIVQGEWKRGERGYNHVGYYRERHGIGLHNIQTISDIIQFPSIANKVHPIHPTLFEDIAEVKRWAKTLQVICNKVVKPYHQNEGADFDFFVKPVVWKK